MSDQRPDLPRFSFPLFVPADRPERFEKAASAGTDTIIIDLEDAVAASMKPAALAKLAGGMAGRSGCQTWVRVNGSQTLWHENDIEAVKNLPVSGVMLPKAESADEIQVLRAKLRGDQYVIALVETVRGVHQAEEIAQVSDRIAFGSVDYALDMGCQQVPEALLFARSRLIAAARLANRPAPLDGVTTKTSDVAFVEADSRLAFQLGFGGKMLIHPAQITPARAAFAPTEEEMAWAGKILEDAADGAAVAVDGEMVDAPVLERARGVIERGDLTK